MQPLRLVRLSEGLNEAMIGVPAENGGNENLHGRAGELRGIEPAHHGHLLRSVASLPFHRASG